MRTPYFLIDKSKLAGNIQAMSKRARKAGVNFRPHVKTHKTIEAARLQIEGNFGGITVSTLAEAFFFANSGFRDITYAFPITPDKFSDVQKLKRQTEHFHVVLDHPTVLEKLEDYADRENCTFSAFLKVDTGSLRAGVNMAEDQSIELAKDISQSSNIFFQGVLAHAGHTYHGNTVDEIKRLALREVHLIESFADKLNDHGITCPVISIGSTPGNVHGTTTYKRINEIRPGNYVFFDKTQVDLGSCTIDEVACFVMTRIIGQYPDRNRLLIDAGALALSKDPGAVHKNDEISYGYVVGHPNLKITGLSQEHGIIDQNSPIDYSKYPIGSMLKVIPNHSCLTAALFPEYKIEENGNITDTWIPVRGW